MPSTSGGGTTSTNTVQNTTPWSGQIPYLETAFSRANDLANNGPQNWPKYFPTSTYEPLNNQQQSLIGQLVGAGDRGGTGVLNQGAGALYNVFGQGTNATAGGLPAANATLGGQMDMFGANAQTAGTYGQGQNYLRDMISGSTLNPWSSPGFQNVVNSTLANVIPATSAGFIGGGRADSGLAQAAQTNAATNAIGGLAFDQYNKQQQLQQQAANMAGQQGLAGMGLGQSAAQQSYGNFLNQQNQLINAAGQAAPNIDTSVMKNIAAGLTGAGMTQANQQGLLKDAVDRFNYEQTLPWNMLTQFQNVVGGSGFGSSSNTTGSQPFFNNTLANVGAGVGAAASVATLGSLLYSALAAAPAVASDRNLKTDIHKIGEADSGFPLYTFRYKGEPVGTTHIGLMAQDVQKKRPDAVVRMPWGLAVHYDKALA